MKEINDIKDTETVKECVTQNWFRRFEEGDASLDDKTKSWRPSVMEDGALLEMVEQQLSTIIHTLLAELGPSQRTISPYLHKLGLVNRC